MVITTAVNEGVAFMQVTGELDLAVADEFREAGLAALTQQSAPLSSTSTELLSWIPRRSGL